MRFFCAIVSITSCPTPSRRLPNPNDPRGGDLTLRIIEGGFFPWCDFSVHITSIRSYPNPLRRIPNPKDPQSGFPNLMIVEGYPLNPLWSRAPPTIICVRNPLWSKTHLQSLGSGTHYCQKHPPCGSLGLGIRLEGVGQLVRVTMAQKNHIVGKNGLMFTHLTMSAVM